MTRTALTDRQRFDLIEAIDWPWQPPEYSADDHRVDLVDSVLPLAGLRVIEPGCVDGAVTASLVRRGARVTAFDVRPRNVLRTQARLLMHDLSARVRVADVRDMPHLWRRDRFDLLFHCGVFYHLPDPVEHLRSLRGWVRWIALDTHIARPADPPACLAGYWGHWFSEQGWDDPFSGADDRSFWLGLDDLLRLADECGFEFRATLDFDAKAPNGPRVLLLLERDD